MARLIGDAVLDAALDKIATGTRISVCSAQPAGMTAADVDAVALATKTGVTAAAYTKANGDVSGRKLTVAQQADVPISATGDATHVVIDDGTSLLHATVSNLQGLSSGGTVTIPAFDIELEDPVAP